MEKYLNYKADKSLRSINGKVLLFMALISIAGVLIFIELFNLVQQNFLHQSDLHILLFHLVDEPFTPSMNFTQSEDDCSMRWRSALLLNYLDDPNELESVMNCSQLYLPLVMAIRPLDFSLAKYAVTLYPQSFVAWYWLGVSTSVNENDVAIFAYQKSLSINPQYGSAWCNLGEILEKVEQFENARDVYYTCCDLGDVELKGCYGAGRIEEKFKNYPAAIIVYRKSHWIGALSRADLLERKLIESKKEYGK